MFDFIKGIIIFITTITLPISGLFVHSKPVASPILTPTPTISISISPTPKNSPLMQAMETTTNPSVTPVLPKNLQKIGEVQQVRQQIQEELNSKSTSITYSQEDCEKQIKEIIPQVDQAYVDWWNEFQEARKSLANCYSNESALICSRKHSDLNVEWQNKITETINNYKKSLSKCTSGSNVQFSKYSSVISSSY